MQVALAVLHAILTRRAGSTKGETKGISRDTMVRQQHLDDLRHALVLKDARVTPVSQVAQVRYQYDAVAVQALARIALCGLVYLAVDTITRLVQLQECLPVQQRLQVDIGAFADQLEDKSVRPAERFLPSNDSTCRSLSKPSIVQLKRLGWLAGNMAGTPVR